MSSSRLSNRYAKALFGLGQEDGQYEQYGQSLKAFAEFCRANHEFGQVVATPVFALEDRKKILQAVLEKSDFPGLVNNFLYLLLDKNRMGAIEAIAENYATLSDEYSNIARAEIVTAKPLKSDAVEKIETSLAAMTNKKVQTTIKEDASLIGGVVVKIGDLVLDGSVRAQIEGLKESLKRGEID